MVCPYRWIIFNNKDFTHIIFHYYILKIIYTYNRLVFCNISGNTLSGQIIKLAEEKQNKVSNYYSIFSGIVILKPVPFPIPLSKEILPLCN